MKHLNQFIELTRLTKPIGYMLLFWPCLWGLTLAYDFSAHLTIYIKYLILFFLGITFNYGLILAWISLNNEISIIPIIFYIGAIFWTLGYDTIYGYQDIKDDEIIGVKSTSIKFKNNTKIFLISCYSVFFISLIIVGILMNFSNFFYFTLLVTFLHLFYYQVKSLNTKIPENCLKLFKSNNFLGLIVYINILAGKFL